MVINNKENKMRYYGFGNYYLSSLQQGLQAAHGVGDILTEFEYDTHEFKIAREWAKNHKTMILLNGGNSEMLQSLYAFFEKLKEQGMNLPFIKFHEDEMSLNNALTHVGIVIPEKYYNLCGKIEDRETYSFLKDWEINLINKLTEYRLAH